VSAAPEHQAQAPGLSTMVAVARVRLPIDRMCHWAKVSATHAKGLAPLRSTSARLEVERMRPGSHPPATPLPHQGRAACRTPATPLPYLGRAASRTARHRRLCWARETRLTG
jgi:hypothetical protein